MINSGLRSRARSGSQVGLPVGWCWLTVDALGVLNNMMFSALRCCQN